MGLVTRRHLLQGTTAFAVLGVVWKALPLRNILKLLGGEPLPVDFSKIPVRLLGPSSRLGHQMRDGFKFPEPTQTLQIETAIVGGGVAGLSAGWQLQRQGSTNFRLFELEPAVGGNSTSGENETSAYPWGAHYVPLLNEEAVDARALFEELGIITGYDGKVPIYNDYFLCQAPHERLFINGRWQEGLVPRTGLTPKDEFAINAFFDQVQIFREQRGRDGKRAFTIPLDLSSHDRQIRELDKISFSTWIARQGWDSAYLNWYVDYCCRDDFGTRVQHVSAWAGLHYFCSRHGLGQGVESSSVVTWPEGNGWLVHALRKKLESHVQTNALVFQITQQSPKPSSQIELLIFDPVTQLTTKVHARHVIMATPRFVADRVIIASTRELGQKEKRSEMTYAPWMVANLTLSKMPQTRPGTAVSWDNVSYNSASLGYVVATHQNATIFTDRTVLTYYQPLDDTEPKIARAEAASRTAESWRDQIMKDLSNLHPDIAKLVENIDVWIWGHGMIRPTPGFIWGEDRARLAESQGNIHFAHSDMSGISIFEEAHYRGVQAARKVLAHG